MTPPASAIEHELGVDQVAMVFQQPVDAVEFAAFFIGSERQNDVAIGRKLSSSGE